MGQPWLLQFNTWHGVAGRSSRTIHQKHSGSAHCLPPAIIKKKKAGSAMPPFSSEEPTLPSLTTFSIRISAGPFCGVPYISFMAGALPGGVADRREVLSPTSGFGQAGSGQWAGKRRQVLTHMPLRCHAACLQWLKKHSILFSPAALPDTCPYSVPALCARPSCLTLGSASSSFLSLSSLAMLPVAAQCVSVSSPIALHSLLPLFITWLAFLRTHCF